MCMFVLSYYIYIYWQADAAEELAKFFMEFSTEILDTAKASSIGSKEYVHPIVWDRAC